MEQNASLKEALTSVMGEVQRAWNEGQYNDLRAFWDAGDAHPIYLAEEAEDVMSNWPAIEAYWQATDKWNEWIEVQYSDFVMKRIGDTDAMLTFKLRFDVQLNDRPQPIGGSNRTNVFFRKVGEDWKIHTWIEAPLAAITYMRKLYELDARANGPDKARPQASETG